MSAGYRPEDHDSWFVEFARAVERAHGITLELSGPEGASALND